MALIDDPPSKKTKSDDVLESAEPVIEDAKRLTLQLKSDSGENLGAPFDVPSTVTVANLRELCHSLLNTEEQLPCSFYVKEHEITDSLQAVIEQIYDFNAESVLEVVYQLEAVFRVQPVTRCSSSLPGHAQPVISAQFSPNAMYLASGSGDHTVRFWDLSTELPHTTCNGHTNWVLVICWSPDGKVLASACKNGQVRLWNPDDGKQIGSPMCKHSGYISNLAWEPLHSNKDCRYLASASKDGTVCIWDTSLYQCVRTLSGHTACVTCLKWGGEGLIYTASQDRTIKVWRADDGTMCRTLSGHGHWVNTMALHTDYVLRTGAFDPKDAQIVPEDMGSDRERLQKLAEKRYQSIKRSDEPERLVSGSDDFTLFLWTPSCEKKPVARMTGHQQLINQVMFSPDGRVIASASFDKSIKLWDGRTGKYLNSLRGHVQAVYQIAFSADSRLIVSGSKDSTLKVWNVKSAKLAIDLPGHADEVYAVDWSTDGQRVVSGGKDKLLRIWRK